MARVRHTRQEKILYYYVKERKAGKSMRVFAWYRDGLPKLTSYICRKIWNDGIPF